MTAGEILEQADRLRPNAYSAEEKLRWLRRLDGEILAELEDMHEPANADDEAPVLDDAYTVDTELLAPFPYDEELYTAYLFCQIDLHNAEITRYSQSLGLLQAAWRQLADFINRRRAPRGVAAWRM
jgi:hypothetical protein